MCEPISMGVVAGVGALATGYGAYSQYQASQQQAAAAQSAAQMQSTSMMMQMMQSMNMATMQGQQAAWQKEDANRTLQEGKDAQARAADQAKNIREAGETQRDRLLQTAMRQRGAGKVSYASGNVQLDSGSPLDWDMDVAEAAALDADTIRANAALEGYSKEVEGWSQRMTSLGLYNQGVMDSLRSRASQYQSEVDSSMALIGSAAATQRGGSQAAAYRNQGTTSLISGVGTIASSAFSYGNYYSKKS